MVTRRIARIAAVVMLAAPGIAQAVEPCGKNHYIIDGPCILGWIPANRGLTDLDAYVVAVDPVRTHIVYAGGKSGIFKSQDGGAEWRAAGPMMGLNDAAIAAVRAQFPAVRLDVSSKVAHVVIEARTPETVYAATVGGCVWAQRNIFKSTDGGATWTNDISPPINGCDQIHALVLSPSDAGALYLGNGDAGDSVSPAMKSVDAAATWIALDYLDFRAIAVDPRNALTLYGGTSPYQNPYQNPNNNLPPGVLKSTDGGATWTSTTLVGTGITALAVDPSDSLTVYAVARDWPRSSDDGVYKSVDGGLSWRATGDGLGELLSRTDATALLIDPQHPRNVYLATKDEGVWRSADRGASWTPLNDGLPSLAIRSLALVPAASNLLYAATPEGIFMFRDVTAAGAPSSSGLRRP